MEATTRLTKAMLNSAGMQRNLGFEAPSAHPVECNFRETYRIQKA